MPIDVLPAELLEKITNHLSYDDHLALSQTCHRLYAFSPLCVIDTLKMNKLPNRLHFVATRATEEKVVPNNEQQQNSKETLIEKKTMKHRRAMAFPLTNNSALFKKARIAHLDNSRDYPLPIQGDNLKQLSSILIGCTIDKVTLVIDNMTEANLDEILNFLDSMRPKKVNFALPRQPSLSGLSPLLRDEFANRLALAGIEEVTFSTYGFGLMGNGPDGEVRVKLPFVFGLLRNLFNAGIKNVVIDYGTLLNDSIDNLEKLDVILKETEDFKKPLLLKLNFSGQAHNNLRYYSEYSEALGRRVRVSQWNNANRVTWLDCRICHSITIEYIVRDDKIPHNYRMDSGRIEAFRQRID